MTEIEFENVAGLFHFYPVYPQCADAIGWEGALTNSRPVVAVVARGAIQHIIVVAGAAASPDGDGQIYVVDPFHRECRIRIGSSSLSTTEPASAGAASQIYVQQQWLPIQAAGR